MFVQNGIAYAGAHQQMTRIIAARPIPDHRILVTFSTGRASITESSHLRKRKPYMKKRHIITAALAASLLMNGCGGSAQEQSDTTFGNVAIGGGGYITGIVYSKTEEGLKYCRTDIGGAYRRSKNDSQWVPITDHLGGVGNDNWNLIGIESIATDPVEPNRVYLSCGTYSGSNGAILSSEDYGATWTQTDMPFGMGGNQSGRGVGERLMVNPKDNKQVFCGSRTDGLYVSNDYGKTWEPCAAFPVKGDYFQEKNQIGVMWVEFDPVSNDMFVGVAMKNGECIYRSSDAGQSFEALPANLPGYYPLQAEISSNGYLYLGYSDSCGPNAAVTGGSVCRYSLKDNKFEDITPQCDDNRYGGFSGISVDGSDPDVIVCGTLGFWDAKGENLYRSTDGGDTWTSFYTTSEESYQMDVSDAEWLDWGRGEQNASIGWWMADVEINPFNSDEVSWGTGATLYATKNMTALGTGTPVTVAFDAYGIEETAVFKVVSTPVLPYQAGGHTPELYSIMGDLTGFAHLDANVRPDDAHFMNNGASSDLAVAWAAGNIAAYTNDSAKAPVTYTTDSGATWQGIKTLPERAANGTVALTKDGTRLFWVPGNLSSGVYFTDNFGEKWFKSNGLGMGAKLYADKTDDDVVYATCGGSVYVSKDHGVNFTATGLNVADNSEIVPAADKPGAVWIRSGTSVGYSEDYAATVKYLKGVSGNAIGVGAPKKEGGVMSLYMMGEADGRGGGIYRTDDCGKHWTKLTTETDGFGNLTPSITGDATTYGKFYFATNGRGIIMGELSH